MVIQSVTQVLQRRHAIRRLAFRLLSLGLLMTGLLASPEARCQESGGVGIVEGRIQNGTNSLYLENAEVSVVGSRISGLSDRFGYFRLSNVPAGEVTLRVSYGGLDTRTINVLVPEGGSVRQSIVLTRGDAILDEDAIVLDAFEVGSQRETNANAIATNAQRYADNIKTVVSTAAFGDVNEGNAAEFLKYLPGIAVDYVGSNANTILVRGFGSAYTGVSVDGARVATAGTGNATRATEFWVLNTNSVSRVEVTKEPTPDQPADSLGGSVNMISRSAFEYAKPVIEWQASMSMNDQEANIFKRTPGPYDDDSHKVLPGGYINYINPISKNFGIAINGLISNQFNVQRRRYAYWQRGDGTTPSGASITNPYMSLWTISDSPSDVHRRTASVKTDWRISENQVLGLTLQTNKYFLQYGNRNLQFTPSNIQSFGPTFTEGGLSSSSAANVSMAGRQFYNNADQGTLNYRYDGRAWKVEATLSGSKAKAEFKDTANGHFNSTNTQLVTGTQLAVRLNDIKDSVPESVTITDPSGNVVDFRDLSNYRMTTVQSDPVLGKARMWDSHIDVTRMLNMGENPVELKGGLAYRYNTRDNRRQRFRYDFVGADGIANTSDDNALPYADTNYVNVDNGWGWRDINFVSNYEAYEEFQNHPEYFRRQVVSDTISNLTSSEYLKETVTASYLMGDIKLMRNRLHVIGGVRFEKTKDEGLGPLYDPDAVWVRNPDGSFAYDAGGEKIRKPEAGAPGSLEEVLVTRKERGYRGEASYDDFYPSVHINYNLTPNTVLRAAWAKTLGRPDLSNIVPQATVRIFDPEDGPTEYPGQISATNVALKPWEAANYDLSLEHYFDKGGVISVGVFRKDITDFFSNFTTILTPDLATEFGVPQEYVGYQLTTKINGGDARVDGFEFNLQKPLDFEFLPDWAKHFSFSANTTQLDLQSESNTADFGTFIKSTSNIGLTFNSKRWVIMAKLNHRGKQIWTGWRNDAFFGPETRLFYAPRKYVDLNVEYKVSERMSLFCNVRNLTDVPQLWQIAAPDTPDYARDYWIDTFGRQIVFGMKGTF